MFGVTCKTAHLLNMMPFIHVLEFVSFSPEYTLIENPFGLAGKMSQQLRVLPFFLNLSLVHSIYNEPLKTPVTPASGHLMLSAGPSGA